MFSAFVCIFLLTQPAPASTQEKPARKANVALAKPAVAKPQAKAAAKPQAKPVAAKPQAKTATSHPATPKAPGKPAMSKHPVAGSVAAPRKSVGSLPSPEEKEAHAASPVDAAKTRGAPVRVIHGTAGKPKDAPVHLVNVRAPERRVEGRKPDKRKVRPAQEAKPKSVAFPPMGIYNIHLREFVSIRVYDENGYFRPQAVEEFNRVSRCVRTGVQLPMDYRLLVEVYQAWLAFGMPSVTLFSGCRQFPHASRNSRHNFGLAVDFNFDGVPRREVVSYFLKRREVVSHGMGVGYYPNSYHVHVDVREKHAFWVDLQQGGEKGSDLVANPLAWFANEGRHRREAEKPQKLAQDGPSTALVEIHEDTEDAQQAAQ